MPWWARAVYVLVIWTRLTRPCDKVPASVQRFYTPPLGLLVMFISTRRTPLFCGHRRLCRRGWRWSASYHRSIDWYPNRSFGEVHCRQTCKCNDPCGTSWQFSDCGHPYVATKRLQVASRFGWIQNLVSEM